MAQPGVVAAATISVPSMKSFLTVPCLRRQAPHPCGDPDPFQTIGRTYVVFSTSLALSASGRSRRMVPFPSFGKLLAYDQMIKFATQRLVLRSMLVCTTCHNTTCRFQEVRESRSQPIRGKFRVHNCAMTTRNEGYILSTKREEATRATSCASASLQRVRESRWQHRQDPKDAVSGQEDGKHQANYRVGKTGARRVERRTVQSSTVFRNVWRQEAMVPWE